MQTCEHQDVSLRHMNKNFNVEVQDYFMTVKQVEGKYKILKIVDKSTGYGERSIGKSRNA